jgi:hypothetical protein
LVYYLSYTTKRRPAPQIGYTMPTNTATTTKNDTADAKAMLKDHAAAIAERLSATSGGSAMRLTKRINSLELRMYRAGVTFESFKAPMKVSEKRYTMTPDELLTEITELRAIQNSDAPGRVRTTAGTEADRLTEQAKRRGIEVATTE